MYIDIVPNRNSPPAVLLRESWRDGKKTYKKTIANISHWPEDKIQSLRQLLKGQKLVPLDKVFQIKQSLPHGHVKAVLGTIRKIGLEKIISVKSSYQRDLIIGMIIQQILHGSSKLGDTRLWHSTTLAKTLNIKDADENDLYDALDWLLERQKKIEKKLAHIHLQEGAYVFYDITNSYYEGKTCPLALFGNGKDGKKKLPIIVYGTMTDEAGRPISVQVYPGNTGDSSTIPDQIQKIRKTFSLNRVVIVGDRGMLTEVKIKNIKEFPGLGWISALRSNSIRNLIDEKSLQLSLFDTQNLAEIKSPDFPGERLVACFNPLLANDRRRKREELLKATEKKLEKIKKEVNHRTKKLLSGGEISLKVGKIINSHKMKKHFNLTIAENKIEYSRNEESIKREQELDGIYIIRTSEPKGKLTAEDTVRQYKKLALVERVFRTCKGLDILIRPIRHRLEKRVKAHIFLCMLAYYVEWHMRKALSPLLYQDEEIDSLREIRDPVLPAESSASAKKKKKTHKNKYGLTVHSFDTLLEELGTQCENICSVKKGGEENSFCRITEPNELQKKAFDLLGPNDL